ncbi:hypothetical protein OPV22_024975 [Ensete ventricosum]|uniref:Uncharacterized protein n=1 Tax=Ensete ventricosum TaxID=4639 RepID=A0AAV8Q6M3_ENSVE|nr:hypothetical protein OPV22_024975 [Ensete ventricosum]
MAERYMASCQLSVALISRRSTLAFSAVSLDLPAAAAADSLSAVASGSSETGTSRGAVRDGGAHQGRFASPGGEGTAATLAVAAIVLGRWIFAGRRVGGDGKVVAMGTGIRKEKRDRLKDGEGVWVLLNLGRRRRLILVHAQRLVSTGRSMLRPRGPLNRATSFDVLGYFKWV